MFIKVLISFPVFVDYQQRNIKKALN